MHFGVRLALPGVWLCSFLLALATLYGCGREEKAPSDAAAPPRETFDLQLLVIDDPPLAEAIGQLRAEWKARTGANVVITPKTSAELGGDQSLVSSADAIIHPSVMLGEFAERGWIQPLPADYATHQELAWSDNFELLQIAESRWGQTTYAVPFGSAVLTCYYRPDLLEKFHKRPPQTWNDYQDLAEFFSRRENLGDAAPAEDAAWFGALEPLSPGWAGRMFLARAAAYVRHRDHFSTLFQIDTMEPLIAGEGFVRALEEIVATAKTGKDALELDPAACRERFLAGEAALALTFPGHSPTASGATEGQELPIALVELPGSPRVYDFARARWNTRKADESQRVTLLSLTGRLGSIGAQAARADNAFALLAWLAGKEWGGKISPHSQATTLYRRSQMRTPLPWLDPGTQVDVAQQYASSLRDALNRQTYLIALRIPGHQRYMAALDEAVAQAVRGEKPPREALQAAAEAWRAITQELGLDQQRAAYRNSLGLEQ